MSGNRPTSPQPAPRDIGLDGYLSEFAAALHGPRRRCRALVNEVADGLDEATKHYRAQGLAADHARQAALAEFGAPGRLAAGFADELTVAYARQTVVALLVTGPMVGIWWLFLLAPAAWWHQPLTLLAAIPALLIVGGAALTGFTVIATTGQLTRWLPETAPHRALYLATWLSAACIGIDLTMLLALGARTLTDQPAGPPLLAAAAVTASLIRLAYTIHTARQLRRLDSLNNRPTLLAEHRA